MTLQLTVPPAVDSPRLSGLPVAIIGAGPVGLAAAAALLERGQRVVVFEAGPGAGHAMRGWAHTRFFSPWEYVLDAAAVRLLDRHGWEPPQAGKNPSGAEFLRQYLLPLAQTPELAAVIGYNSPVLAVSKEGMDRTRSVGRSLAPYVLQVSAPDGVRSVRARAVIDASGTYGQPNSLLSSGLPVLDELAAEHILPALPDVLGQDRAAFVGKHIVVVGAGHSAANTLLKLANLVRANDGTRVTWVVRSRRPSRVYGSAADELAARGKLGTELRALVRGGVITLVDSLEIDEARWVGGTREGQGRSELPGQLELQGRRRGEPLTLTADLAIAATGFRPDLGLLSELRLAMDQVVEAPRALAGLIDPHLHSCGTVEPHGVAELAHPDANLFIAGMKSYGRAPTFLLLTGYEQVRSIADELAGEHAAARAVHLVLPATGVCSTESDGGCCA
ncbi:FAD-dependent oxidoreductase [Galactobacter caseinivorans]|uniref:FAD-dependent oxidoreductase n=1 Tax=Galactobacter caseinivorans TaxID=2676123 RepID=A0A496PLP3_9MICC|nr:FAD-dependent oxidoreductase [Galactobacter caseinivorans]RKW71364.1 FAD-dependent oxidoreductase [Galactobacter caseinivorans]